MNKNKELSNMPILAVIIKFRYINSLLFTLVDSKNSLEDSLHFFDLNEATRKEMNNARKSKKYSII